MALMLIMIMLSTLLARTIPPYKNASPGVINRTSAELASIQAVSPVLGWPSVGKLTRYHLRSAANSRQTNAWGLNQNLAHWLLQKAARTGFAGVTSRWRLNSAAEIASPTEPPTRFWLKRRRPDVLRDAL